MYNQNKSIEEKVSDLQKDYDALATKLDQTIAAAAQKIRGLEDQIRKIEKKLPPAAK